MVLSYSKYIELLSALDEYSNCTLEKLYLQNAIFDHYSSKYGSFVAENSKKSKRLFVTKHQRDKNNRRERKVFRNFMNSENGIS